MESSHFAAIVGATAHGGGGGSQQLQITGVAIAQREKNRLRRPRPLLDAFKRQRCQREGRQIAETHAAGLSAVRPERCLKGVASSQGGPDNAVGHRSEEHTSE